MAKTATHLAQRPKQSEGRPEPPFPLGRFRPRIALVPTHVFGCWPSGLGVPVSTAVPVTRDEQQIAGCSEPSTRTGLRLPTCGMTARTALPWTGERHSDLLCVDRGVRASDKEDVQSLEFEQNGLTRPGIDESPSALVLPGSRVTGERLE